MSGSGNGSGKAAFVSGQQYGYSLTEVSRVIASSLRRSLYAFGGFDGSVSMMEEGICGERKSQRYLSCGVKYQWSGFDAQQISASMVLVDRGSKPVNAARTELWCSVQDTCNSKSRRIEQILQYEPYKRRGQSNPPRRSSAKRAEANQDLSRLH